jgi:ATP-dependent exoDNAse (exonuclease V) alpha subunit
MNDPQKRWVNGTIGTVENCTKTQIQVRINGKVFDVDKYTWEVFAYKFDKKTENLTTENKGTMTQFPIRLAWANTVHKSQGMTFDNMHIEMDTGFFAHGMAYVALSRCRGISGLSLSNKLCEYDIIYDPNVMSYLSDLDY